LPGKLARHKNVRMVHDVADAIGEAHIVVMLVNHRAYNEIAPAELNGKVVIDTRGVWS